MSEVITIHGVEYARMYCICGYEYKVIDNQTLEEYLYEIDYHKAIHPAHSCIPTWDVATLEYYQKLDPGWRKMERIRG